MKAGVLRDRITIQEQTRTPDGRGGYVLGAWGNVTNMARIPAEVAPLSGDERIQAMQVQSGVGYEVRIRYRAGVHASQRALWHAKGGDRTLHMVGAPVVEGKHEGLRWMAREDTD